MTLHGAFSVIAVVRLGKKEELTRLLQQIDADTRNNNLVPFGKLTSIHFARFVICNEITSANGDKAEALLAFTTNYDNPFDQHLDELVANAGEGLWKIFSLCEGFTAGSYHAPSLLRYLQTHNTPANTFYVGVGNRSVAEIRQENELRTHIENFIDDNKTNLQDKRASEIRNIVINYVQQNPGLAWAKIPVPGPSSNYRFSRTFKLIAAIVLFFVFLPLIAPFVIIWMLIILGIEITEKNKTCVVSNEHIHELVDRETGIVQNQFSAYGNVKKGWFRVQTMLFLLKLTNFLAPYLFSKGRLSGIPTVHFARWIILNNGKQMLFLSNYDGNSEGYLRDFINIAAKQLTLMFCHTEGYPKTRLMVFGGAKDAKNFMLWARQKQTITNVWYSANPDVTVKNIFHNSAIRAGLYGNMTETQAADWLRLF